MGDYGLYQDDGSPFIPTSLTGKGMGGDYALSQDDGTLPIPINRFGNNARGLGQDLDEYDNYDSLSNYTSPVAANGNPSSGVNSSTNLYASPSFGSILAGIDANTNGSGANGGSSGGGSNQGSSSPSAIDQGLVAALNSGISAAAKVLGTRYAVPQTNPGQYVSTNAYGTTTYTLPTGSTSNAFSTSALSASLSSMLPLLLIGGLALVLFSGMSHH